MSIETSKLPNSYDKTKTKTIQLFSEHICNACTQEPPQISEERRKFNLKLIEEYKKEECLWNVNSEKILIFMLKKPAWERIAANMGKNVSVDLVKNRIYTMRCQLQDEAAKVKYTKTAAVPNSQYYFAKHFGFLDEMLANRKILREKKPLTLSEKVENEKSSGHIESKMELQSSKPITSKKNKSVLGIGSTSTLIGSRKINEKKSPRSNAGGETSVSNATAPKSLASNESGEESSSSSIWSLSSKTSHKSVKKSSLNFKSSTRSRISSTTGDESPSCPTWYTSTASSASPRSPKLPEALVWEPLKFKNRALKSSFTLPFKRSTNSKIQIRKEPTQSSTKMIVKKPTSSYTSLKSIKSNRVESSSLESSPRETISSSISKSYDITSEVEKKVRLHIEHQRQENLLNYPRFGKYIIKNFGKKIEDDDKKFFDKMFEKSEASELEDAERKTRLSELKNQLVQPQVYYKLENYLKSINSPAANIVVDLNKENSKQMCKDMLTRGYNTQFV